MQSPRKTSDREEEEAGVDISMVSSLPGHCEPKVTKPVRLSVEFFSHQALATTLSYCYLCLGVDVTSQ